MAEHICQHHLALYDNLRCRFFCWHTAMYCSTEPFSMNGYNVPTIRRGPRLVASSMVTMASGGNIRVTAPVRQHAKGICEGLEMVFALGLVYEEVGEAIVPEKLFPNKHLVTPAHNGRRRSTSRVTVSHELASIDKLTFIPVEHVVGKFQVSDG